MGIEQGICSWFTEKGGISPIEENQDPRKENREEDDKGKRKEEDKKKEDPEDGMSDYDRMLAEERRKKRERIKKKEEERRQEEERMRILKRKILDDGRTNDQWDPRDGRCQYPGSDLKSFEENLEFMRKELKLSHDQLRSSSERWWTKTGHKKYLPHSRRLLASLPQDVQLAARIAYCRFLIYR